MTVLKLVNKNDYFFLFYVVLQLYIQSIQHIFSVFFPNSIQFNFILLFYGKYHIMNIFSSIKIQLLYSVIHSFLFFFYLFGREFIYVLVNQVYIDLRLFFVLFLFHFIIYCGCLIELN
jgi:hypothetical protein